MTIQRGHFATLVLSATLLVVALAPCRTCDARERAGAAFEGGRAAYLAGRFDEAVPLLERAIEEATADAEAHAWLAFTYARLERSAEAVETGRRAVALAPCNTVAHEALGRAFNPQYHQWTGADPESAWAHVLAATGCDSLDANAWTDVWIGGLQRERHDLARRAIRGLYESKQYRSPLLEYTRWVLRDLPPHAVLITNGDADTYPALVLQQAESLRTDVAIVNLPLLALPWYRRYVRDRMEVPMPVGPDVLDSLDFEPDGTGGWTTPGTLLLESWLGQLVDVGLSRPLAAALTVEEGQMPAPRSVRRVLCGAYWLFSADSAAARVDTSLARRGLMRLRPADFMGSAETERSHSPYQAQTTVMIRLNIAAALASYYVALRQAGDAGGARSILAWGDRFFANIKADDVRKLLKERSERYEAWRRESLESDGRGN